MFTFYLQFCRIKALPFSIFMNKEYVAAAMYYITYSTWEIFKHILYTTACWQNKSLQTSIVEVYCMLLWITKYLYKKKVQMAQMPHMREKRITKNKTKKKNPIKKGKVCLRNFVRFSTIDLHPLFNKSYQKWQGCYRLQSKGKLFIRGAFLLLALI